MTETQRVTNEVCDRHLPPSLDRETEDNCMYAPDGREELRQAMRGKPYLDVDGNWHTGRDYRDQSEVPDGNAMVGAFWGMLFTTIAVGIVAALYEAWPRIWGLLARIF